MTKLLQFNDFRDDWVEREIKTTKSNMVAKFK